MNRFANKTVLVTGGSNGIGLATALRIEQEGGQVIITGTNPQRLDQAREVLSQNALLLANDAAAPAAATAEDVVVAANVAAAAVAV